MCYSFFYLIGDRSIKKHNYNELCSFTVIGAIKKQLTNHNALFLEILYMNSY